MAQDLDNIVETENNSRAGVKRNIDVKSTVSAILTNGDAVTIDMAGETTGSVTPRPVNVDPKGYYLLGDFTENSKDGNGWQPTAPVYMKETAKGSGIYKAVVNTIKDDSYYSIYGASSFVSGNWDEINKSVYGSPTADNSATEGLLVYTGDDGAHAPNGVKAMVIKGANKWQITFDANNLTYSVSRKYDDLFLTGSEYNWGKQQVIGNNLPLYMAAILTSGQSSICMRMKNSSLLHKLLGRVAISDSSVLRRFMMKLVLALLMLVAILR